MFQHAVFVIGSHHPKGEREDVGGDGVVGIVSGNGIEIAGVICLGDGVDFIFEILYVVFPMKVCGKSSHYPAILDVVWR